MTIKYVNKSSEIISDNNKKYEETKPILQLENERAERRAARTRGVGAAGEEQAPRPGQRLTQSHGA